jgi:CheY-like chemotaxis protein
MSEPANVILLVDPDVRARSFLASQLQQLGGQILQAADGPGALAVARAQAVKLVITELYLAAGEDECLVHAIRRDPALRRTRVLAHTNRSTAADREWAMRAGADAYLIKPTRAERMRYVVGRLTSSRAQSSHVPATSSSPIVRRVSLDVALDEMEAGKLNDVSCIVFARTWWEDLSRPQQAGFRRRAKSARVSLRSDSMLSNHFVEVRGHSRTEQGLSTERPESPYRR